MPATERRLELVLERDRETKRKVRYTPTEEQPAVGALYLDKEAAAKLGSPGRLTATLAAPGEDAPLILAA